LSQDLIVANFVKCEDDVLVVNREVSLAMRPKARMMSEFERALHSQVDQAQQALGTARQAGHDYEVHLHAARIQDLLDLAATHGIDTGDWIDPALLESATLGDRP
jgi:hypothetical protein